ncbi:MAG: hypothetical protein AAF597_20765, partial [Bacteroidota bacterium]
PEFYRFIDDERVMLQSTDRAQLEEWEGPHRFFWRVKIKAIEDVAARYPGSHVFYQDADTFCFNDPSRLRAQLDAGRNFMHAREGALSQLPTSTERKMWAQCKGKSFGGVTINAEHNMWNAGVVAIAAEHLAAVIPTALAICDEMCAAGVTRRLVEQFALSVALGLEQPVLPANGTIGHYWGNKEGWNPLINAFFLQHHLQQSSYADQVMAIRNFDFHQIPIYTKSSKTQQKLTRLVDQLFAKHMVTYAAREVDGSELSERVLARKHKG